jgi:hypothetical protein
MNTIIKIYNLVLKQERWFQKENVLQYFFLIDWIFWKENDDDAYAPYNGHWERWTQLDQLGLIYFKEINYDHNSQMIIWWTLSQTKMKNYSQWWWKMSNNEQNKSSNYAWRQWQV